MANSMKRIGIQLDIKKGDYSALQDLRNDLLYARNLIKEMSDIKVTGMIDTERIQSAMTSVSALEKALNKSYDVNLQTINVQKFNQLLAQSGVNLKTLQSGLSEVGYIGDRALLKLTSQLMQFSTVTKQTNKFLNDLSSSFFNTIRWGVMSRIMNTMVGTIQKSYGYIKDLDTALNDIRIVTGKSADDMAEFAVQANEAAKALAVTTQEYTEGSLIYYQQGLDDETVKTLTDITAKTSNVTGQSMESVSEQLTAVWNGYRVANEAAEEGMGVYEEYVDKMAAVGAATASDLEELSTAMSKVASAASSMGVDFDDLNAQIATIVSVTRQAPESVGTALKTIYARLGDLKVDGVDEFGTKLGEVSAQLQQMGISILDSSGDMRNMSDVIADVAKKWDTWTSAQKQAAAVAMAGKRQYNNLIALFDNWDMYGDTLKVSMEAAGTLEEQQMIAMDSMANKMDVLKATAEDLYDSLFNKDTMIGFVEAGTNVLQFLADFTDSVGGLNNLLPILGATLLRTFSTQIADGISTIVINTRNMAQAEEMAKSNAAALNAMFSDSSLFGKGTTEGQQTAIQKGLADLKQVYSDLQPLQQYMSDSQKQQYEQILQITERAGDFKLQVEEIKDRMHEVNVLFGHSSEGARFFDEELLKGAVDAGKMSKEVTKINILIQELEDLPSKVKNGTFRNESGQITTFKKLLSSFNEEVKLSGDQIEILEKKWFSLGNDASLEERIKVTTSALKEFAEQGTKLSNIASQAENATESFKTLSASLKADLEIKATVTNITNAVGAAGQLAMSITTLSNVTRIWGDDSLSTGQKILQTITNVGMSLPMLISSFAKMNETLGALFLTSNMKMAQEKAAIAIREADSASMKVKNAQLEAEAAWEEYAAVTNVSRAYSEQLEEKAIEKSTIANQLEKESIEKNTLAEQLQILSSKGNIITKGKEVIAILTHKSALDADTQALLLNKAAFAGVAAAIAIGIAAIALYIKYQEQQLKNQIEANKEAIEAANKIQEEADANNELYKSYEKTYQEYKNNKVEKEALFDTTDKLCDKYKIEGAHLAELTGNYDKLTEAIKKAHQAELEEALASTQDEINKSSENVLAEGRLTKQAAKFGDSYQVNFNRGVVREASDKEAEKFLSQYVTTAARDQEGNLFSLVDANDTAAIVEQYHQIEEAFKAMNSGMEAASRNSSEVYQNTKKYLSDMAETVKEYETALSDADKYTIELAANQFDLAEATSLEDFQQKVENFRKVLSTKKLNGTESIDDIVSKYIDSLDTTYGNLALGIEELKKQVDDSADEYIDSLSEGEKEYLLSGKVDLTFVQTKEDIEAELQKSFDSYGTFDVTTPTSLASTLAKGTKLKKKDNQAIEELESEDYASMAGFDDKSVLHQLDVIDEVTQHRIDKNYEFIQEYEKVIQKEIDLRTQEKEAIFKTEEEYQKAQEELKKNANLSREEQAALKEKIDTYEELGYAINDLNNDLNANLSFDQIEDIGFDSLISGIDMVVNKAQTLQTAAELIGEGFSVAASDVEKFSNLFPELLDQAKVLSDGSLQLDKEIVEENLAGIQAEMEARTEAKILEVDQQIALKEIEQQYLQEKLKNLELYLQGKQSEQQTVDAINKAGQEYESGLNKILGEENTELTQLSIDNAELEGKSLIDMLNQVGAGFTAAAKAHYALATGQNPGEWTPLTFGSVASSAHEYASNAGDEALKLYEKAADEYTDIYNQALEVQGQLNTVTGELDKLRQEKVVLESTGKATSHALDNVRSGQAGKDSKSKSGGSKKDKKDKDDKKLEDEFDRYWEIKKAIDATDRSLKKLDKDQENLYGKELINSLHQENELLEQQAANYTALAEAQKQEAAELQSVLSGYGVAFDASGAITNYAAATAAALQQYNDAIHQYNMGLIDESTLGVYEKNYEKFKKALERYDQLFYTEMKDTEEKLDEIRRKELANNLKAWEVEIQLKLDMKDLERQWNDFIHKVTKDFKKVYSDLRVDLKNMLKDASTYVGDEGTINTIIGGVHDVANEIDKMRFGGTSDMFESISQAQEKLKELNSQLLESGEALHDLVEQAYDNLLDGIDQVADQFDDLIDRFEKINDELEFQKQIIELLYGEEAYGLMSKYYEGQLKNTGVQIESLKQQVDFWQKEFEISGATMENQKNWTKEQQKIYEQLIEAQGDLNDKVLEYIQLLKDEYLNTVKDVLKQFDNFISGSSLENVKTQWERISDRADKYYDSVEKAYEVQNLANKMDKDIAATTNLKTQQKLKALRDSEIEFLREKEKLTQHDIEYSEAKFQIALKEAALEDAQNNKTSMKLTRNEQGNWSYQYIADEEDTMSKRQELLDAYNQLYQLASDAYEKNLESMQELQEKYLQSALEIRESDTLSEDEKTQQLAELDEWYFQTYQALAEENAQYRDELVEAGSALLLEVYEEDQTAYEYMSETERELLDALVQAHIDGFLDLEEKLQENYQNIGDKAKDVMTETREDWTSGAQHIADIWNGDGGDSVRNQLIHVYNVIEQATQHYKDMVDWCAEAVGRDFSEEGIAGAIMKAENETDNLRNKTAQLVNESHGYLADLRRYIEEIEAAWQSVQQAIMDAIGLIQEYLKYMGAASAAGASGGVAGGGAAEGESPSRSSNGGSGGSSSSSSNDSSGPTQYNLYRDMTLTKGGVGEKAYQGTVINKRNILKYATGGYTGEWNNDDGKVAMLHQKELVLNQDDTKIFLSGIKMIRDLSSGASIGEAVMRAVANTALSFGAMKAGTGASVSNDNRRETSNVFNISAEFPNANDVTEIREAILSLPNLASQYINNNLR